MLSHVGPVAKAEGLVGGSCIPRDTREPRVRTHGACGHDSELVRVLCTLRFMGEPRHQMPGVCAAAAGFQ